jgi:DNA-binding transcriptional MerR regulator
MVTMRMRVEELALAAEVSVDTVRYYQKQRLLPPPGRDGRLAFYDDEHLARILIVIILGAITPRVTPG